MEFGVWNWNAETRAEDLQLFVIKLFLLVCNVLAFARFTQSISLNGLGENDGGRSRMVDRRSVRRMNLDRIMTAEPHAGQLFVRKMFHHLQQPGIGAKEILPEIGAALDEIFLILAVGDLAHSPDQQAIAIRLDKFVPIAAPNDLNNIPPGAAEDCFQFLDDLAVPAHWPVKALQIAVDDEN